MSAQAPSIQIVPYEESDRDAVIALWRVVFPNEPAHNDPTRVIQNKLAVQRDLFFVAKVGTQVIGTAIAGYDGHRGWVYKLAVSPAYQRQGIGRVLMKHVETTLRRLGCPKLNLQVRSTNAAVVAFYRACGYVVEENISMGKLLS